MRVLATARTLAARQEVIDLGAEPLHADLANLAHWRSEAEPAEAIFHLALPRLQPPLRRAATRRHAKLAEVGALALGELAGERPIVMASSGLVYGDRSAADPAVDGQPAPAPGALARVAARAEASLPFERLRVVRLPWAYGPAGLMRDLIVGLRTRRFRIVGPGDNRWGLISHRDAAAALAAALWAPPGVYTAAERDIPTQLEVVHHICTVPGHRRPDRAPAGLSAMIMGGAMSGALGASLALRSGRLAELGWAPERDWRRELVSLAEGSLPRARA